MKRSKEEIAQSLQGNWRQEYLFELKVTLSFYYQFQQALLDCDQVIEQALRRSIPAELVLQPPPKTPETAKKKSSKNAPAFALSGLAYHYFKTDLFAISGVSHNTVLCLLTSLCKDIDKFTSAKSFASGRIISHRTPSGKSYIASALRQAANSIGNQKDHELSPFFKRIAYKKGRVAAITATARKLAVIIWHMLTKEEPYKKAQVKATVQKTREAGLRQVQRRLVALDLSQDELRGLFAKASLSVG